MSVKPEQKFAGWVILEILGHRRLGGYVREEEIAGIAFLRIDIPDEEDKTQATQFYSGHAIYCITPVTEAMARAVAIRNKPQPVQRWELPAPEREPDGESRGLRRCNTCEHRAMDHVGEREDCLVHEGECGGFAPQF